MKQFLLGMLFWGIVAGVLFSMNERSRLSHQESPRVLVNGADISVWFSPKGGCADEVVQALDAATNSVFVQAYSFTSTNIASALVRCRGRGMDVRVILDAARALEPASVAKRLVVGHVKLQVDEKHAIAHNKLMIVDGQTVITGSYNFTAQAEKSNAENLLVIKSEEMASEYLSNWKEHSRHSVAYSSWAPKQPPQISPPRSIE